MMKQADYQIEEGLIEQFVLGLTAPEETERINALADQYPSVQVAIDSFCTILEQKAMANAVPPPVTLKPAIMATIDYMERLTKGEQPGNPPLLNEKSTIADYATWLNRPDMVLPTDFQFIHSKIIGHTAEASTAIVWLSHLAPEEVHHDEHERFLILEGTCTITIDGNDHNLTPGDYLAIPLYSKHNVVVTSAHPCKIILQRVAA